MRIVISNLLAAAVRTENGPDHMDMDMLAKVEQGEQGTELAAHHYSHTSSTLADDQKPLGRDARKREADGRWRELMRVDVSFSPRTDVSTRSKLPPESVEDFPARCVCTIRSIGRRRPIDCSTRFDLQARRAVRERFGPIKAANRTNIASDVPTWNLGSDQSASSVLPSARLQYR